MYIKASRSSALSDLKSGVMTVDQLRSTGDAFTNITNVRRFNGFLIITVGVSLMYFTYFHYK